MLNSPFHQPREHAASRASGHAGAGADLDRRARESGSASTPASSGRPTILRLLSRMTRPSIVRMLRRARVAGLNCVAWAALVSDQRDLANPHVRVAQGYAPRLGQGTTRSRARCISLASL